MTPSRHIRKPLPPFRSRGRMNDEVQGRFAARVAAQRTLCGADVTSLDCLLRDLGDGRWYTDHGGCSACLGIAKRESGAGR